jgi:hypothetical protein
MTNQHPITPPPELVDKWYNEWLNADELLHLDQTIAVQAARWGADMELEACCEWISNELSPDIVDMLRAARRPNLPSLKEQALEALETEDDAMPLRSLERSERFALIRRALEALPNE